MSTNDLIVEVMGIRYHNLTADEALERAVALCAGDKSADIVFLNADCLRQAQKDQEYAGILKRADLVLSDGIGLGLITRLYGGTMRDNCNGTDLSPRLMRVCAQKGYSIFLLGGKPGVADKAAEKLRLSMPDIVIAGTHDGFMQSDQEIVELINRSGAHVLFVAMGVPRQEKWIASNRSALNVKVCLGVGALLDYLSGSIPRAPQWMIRCHIEWLWRIFIDPRRMVKRYVVDGVGFMLWALVRKLFRLDKESSLQKPAGVC